MTQRSGIARLLLGCATALLLAGPVHPRERLDAGPAMSGELVLPGLAAPVTVRRDALGIPYIFAASTPDLIRAQGFVSGQNRLFQLEFYRMTASGRLAEIVGPQGLASDREMRILGIRRNAERHAALLSDDARAFLGWYLEGLNAYITLHRADHPAELKAFGLSPEPWTIADVMTILHFANAQQAANYRAELLTQQLIDRFGLARVKSDLLPILRNPDRRQPEAEAMAGATPEPEPARRLGLSGGRLLLGPEAPGGQLAVGSNNWAVAPSRSAGRASVVVNDPHLDARALPGPWQPVGLHAPGIRAVGVALPGVPGLLIGRTAHVAFGVTNAYGDSQDLFIEIPAPGLADHVLEGGHAVPMRRIEEVIRVRDPQAPGGMRAERLVVRATARGPIVAEGLAGGAMLSLRTVAAEVPGGGFGLDRLLSARSVADVDRAVQSLDILYFNFVFGDTRGGIGFRASGRVPIRSAGHGTFPVAADAGWTGMLPPERMPSMLKPRRGWVGTANHDTRGDGTDIYYTSYASPDYRYRRIGQVLARARNMTVDDHRRLLLDTQNLQAPALLPTLIDILSQMPEYADLVTILKAWDGRDDAEKAAPLIYHRLYEQIAFETFVDEMGEDLARAYLRQYYVWQHRFDRMLQMPDSPWFDDVRTPERETLADIVRRAAGIVRPRLEARHGRDPTAWQWGAEHRVSFFSLLRPAGPERDAFGVAARPMSGSGETLMRARTSFGGEDVEFFASMRIVADLADREKVRAVLAGGVVERQFHPHQKDQLPAWSDGQLLDWWLSPARIAANAQATQILRPR